MTILACVDDSDVAGAVVAHAAHFARASGLPLEVTRVLDPLLDLVASPGSTTEIIAQVSAGWREQLAALVSKTGERATVSVTVLNPRERVHQAIARVAGERGANVIAIGSHGAGMVRHAIMGSVAMGVVGEAGQPVLVVGPNAAAPSRDDRYTIVASDDGSEASRAVITALARLPATGAIEVKLLTVHEPRLGEPGGPEGLAQAERSLDDLRATLPAGMRAESLVQTAHEFESVDAAIVRVAGELGADAIAMATRGHSTARHLIAGSVTVGVLKSGPVPLLLVGRS